MLWRHTWVLTPTLASALFAAPTPFPIAIHTLLLFTIFTLAASALTPFTTLTPTIPVLHLFTAPTLTVSIVSLLWWLTPRRMGGAELCPLRKCIVKLTALG